MKMSEKENKNQVLKEEVKNAVAVMEKDIADVIFNRVNEMGHNNQLLFPPNYAVGNALKAAYLIIQATIDRDKKPVLQTCSKISIANALLDMVIQGLNPAKKQCYFIPYAGSLDMQRSYFGDQAAVMTALNLKKKPYACVIYKDDVVTVGFREEDGEKIVISHETTFENIGKEIIGAYAILYTNDDVKHYEIMSMEQIQKSWAKTKVANNSTQKDYPEEMARRTVLRRIAKHWMNTSDDSNLAMVESYNRTTSAEYVDVPENTLELEQELEIKANRETLIVEEPQQEVQAPTTAPKTPPVNGPGF
jgi:recombination protein RecT